MYTVFGAGSVGTVLAALLTDAGVDVALAGRAAARHLLVEGDNEEVHATVPVVEDPIGTILLCVHEPDVPALASRWPGRRIVSFANGVATVDGVSPAVWRMTCTLERPGFARFTQRGRVIVEDEDLAQDLRRTGFDVGVSEDIAADRWLKLYVNLMSAPNALIRKEDHGLAAFPAVKIELLEEARALFLQHGVDARSCDGRDPSLEDEVARLRQGVGTGRVRPVYNSTWRLLARGLATKERYHDVVMGLGAAPKNATMLRLLEAAHAPECYGAQEVLTALRGA